MLPDTALLRARDIRKHYGLSREVFRALREEGVVEEVHFRTDKKGRPVDRAYYRREQIVEVMGE